jgi:ABC-type uncharacterized transport system substrate-binding protein
VAGVLRGEVPGEGEVLVRRLGELGAEKTEVEVHLASQPHGARQLIESSVLGHDLLFFFPVTLITLNASTGREIDAAFATLADGRAGVLLVGGDPFFNSRHVQLANLAAHYSIPMASGSREIAEAGGLMSYGASILDAYHGVGIYAGRILRGAFDLPVLQSSKFELVINASTARMLGLTVPDKLLATADEVIE